MSEAVATKRILLVDDNINALKALEYLLDREGYQVDIASSAGLALERVRKGSFDLVVSDLKMPGMNGLELVAAIRQTHAELPVLIVTAHGSIEGAVDALRRGATDFLLKPYDALQLISKVRAAFPDAEHATEAAPAPAETTASAPGTLIGTSLEMQRIGEQIRALAAKDITVVIYGESGTGKELAARALHEGSSRRDRPFVAINCASIPESLLENELFGHVKGAYTGANTTRKGLLEEAHTGTIFLDEIGDIPASLQAKLLRVLQEQEFKMVGGTRDIRVDLRVITATNKDLREAVRLGRFREDLYYRINVVPLHMPPLRERSDDIPLLANHFRILFNAELGLEIKGFDDDALVQLVKYPWPGNVRELKNRLKMAMALAKGSELTASDFGLVSDGSKQAFPAFRVAKESFEREYVVRALKLCGGNVKKAALLAGRDRSTFYDLLKKHELNADHYRDLY